MLPSIVTVSKALDASGTRVCPSSAAEQGQGFAGTKAPLLLAEPQGATNFDI
jgi:hypothetical protein